MSIPLQLPPELADRLRAEAARRGVSVDALAAEVLDRHLPPADNSVARPSA
jgi:plasmid stability protein